jgi:tRNA-dihydrouridine synthase 2
VEQYIKTSLAVENRWGNTKYLLNHLIPGKRPEYKLVTTSNSYHQACKILGLEHLEAQAKEVDERLGITPESESQGGKGRKNNKSAIAASGNQGKIRSIKTEDKRALSGRGFQNQPPMALTT